MNWKLAIVVRLLFLGTWKSGHWQSDQREHPDHSVTGASFDCTVSNVMYIIHKKHQKYLDAYSWIMEKRFLPPHQRFECSHSWQGFLLNVELEEARGILGMGCQRMGIAPNVEGLGVFVRLAGWSRSDSRQRSDVQTQDLRTGKAEHQDGRVAAWDNHGLTVQR